MNKIKIYASNRGYTADVSKLEDIHPFWFDRDIWVGCALVDDTVDTDDEEALAEAYDLASKENREFYEFNSDDVFFENYPADADWGNGTKENPGSISDRTLWLEEMLENKYSFIL